MKQIFKNILSVILLLGCISCKKKPVISGQETKVDAVQSRSSQDSAMSIAYQGVIKVPSSDTLGVATMVLKTKMGAEKGKFSLHLDFGDTNVNFKNEKVNVGHIIGAYHSEESPDFGELYVLMRNGDLQTPYLYFQPIDNLLNGVDKTTNSWNGINLTGIDLKDTLKARAEVLKMYKKTIKK